VNTASLVTDGHASFRPADIEVLGRLVAGRETTSHHWPESQPIRVSDLHRKPTATGPATGTTEDAE
jgi:hypothetical protein